MPRPNERRGWYRLRTNSTQTWLSKSAGRILKISEKGTHFTIFSQIWYLKKWWNRDIFYRFFLVKS